MLFQKVAIIGVGLIGGSMGLAMKERKLAGEIVGVTSRKSTLEAACALGVVDYGVDDPRQAARDADLIVFATPVGRIVPICKEVLDRIKPGCLITDVGSTKAALVGQLDALIPRGRWYVGSHPIAGSEKKGAGYADRGLFENRLCVLTRTRKTAPAALRKMQRLWHALGSETVVLSPVEHDRILAWISHLPHLLACGLITLNHSRLPYAAGGFYDMTRIASGDPVIWKDIFFSNAKEMRSCIQHITRWLGMMSNIMIKGDEKAMVRELTKAQKSRNAFLERHEGRVKNKRDPGAAQREGGDSGRKQAGTVIRKDLVVAIDGPTACGKSTVGRMLAQRLGLLHLDSGALYRAVALGVLELGVKPADEKAVAKAIQTMKIGLEQSHGEVVIYLNGENVTDRIRQARVSKAVPYVAKMPKVRGMLLKYQRSLVKDGLVAEGRDMCTTVFPNAHVKVYLDAKLSERITRRYDELKALGRKVTPEAVEQDVRERDMIDRQRTASPLRIAPDAKYIDTTRLSAEKVCERILSLCGT
ncbi:MAG: (d)CMP kinase [Candidatus Omnitrophica bacterium]|nr:(d)CMP kinase [Candidatus Omnitrophota bacterium]